MACRQRETKSAAMARRQAAPMNAMGRKIYGWENAEILTISSAPTVFCLISFTTPQKPLGLRLLIKQNNPEGKRKSDEHNGLQTIYSLIRCVRRRIGGYSPRRAEMDLSADAIKKVPESLLAPKFGQFKIGDKNWLFALVIVERLK